MPPVQSSSKQVLWYETKRIGLALEFIAEIDSCVSLASKHPLQFAVVREDIRRVVAHRFPYSVYFRAEKHRIVVLAVFHGSRDPAIWLVRANPSFENAQKAQKVPQKMSRH